MQSVAGNRAFSSRVLAVPRSRAFVGLAVGVLLGTLLVSVAGEQPAGAFGPSYCSGYRWDVKTGQDPQASQVNLGSVTPTTVGYLTKLPAHSNLPDDYRLPPTELTQYEITGKIVDYGIEQHDQDYHVVIQDSSSSNVMIVEFPNPACVPSSSPFATMAANARSTLIAHVAIGATVAIKGPGFFDSNTLTSGVAPNKIELHPVLDINFNPGNDFSMSATPSSRTVVAGSAATSTIGTTVTSGVAQSVALSATGLPAGAVASFTPTPINSGASSSMSITTAPGTAPGPYSVTVTGTGASATHTTTFTLTVTASGIPPAITSTNQATFTKGVAGSFIVTASGSPTPTLSESDALPAGVTFTPSTGVLSGTPSVMGTFPITFTANNGVGSPATQSFSLTVVGFQITTTSLPSGSVYSRSNKVLYSVKLAASGGNRPYTWSLASGSILPPGLMLSSTGLISGRAKVAGTYSFTVQVVDRKTRTRPPTQNTASATLSITIS